MPYQHFKILQVSLLLFWIRPRIKNLYKITQNSSFSVMSTEHTNYKLLGRYVVDRPYNRRNVYAQRHLGFVLNLRKSILTPTQRTKFLGMTVDSLIKTLCLPEKKVSKGQKKSLEHLQKAQVPILEILELTKLIGFLSLTIQGVTPVQINFR